MLETVEPGAVAVAIGLLLLGSFTLWRGWITYTEAVPRFVIDYRGTASLPLALPYGGVFVISMGLVGLQPPFPKLLMGLIGLAWLLSGLIFLMGFLFWFPPFLVPRWYHRAVRAGVPRNDPYAMGTFKALPVEQQKEAARRRMN